MTDAERRELIEQHRQVLDGYPENHPQAEAIRQEIRRLEGMDAASAGKGTATAGSGNRRR